jgi:hypothetical protein
MKMDETKIYNLVSIDADQLQGDIKDKEKHIYNKITFVFEDIPVKQKTDDKGKPLVDKDGKPIPLRYYIPCYRSPESYIIPKIYPELNAIDGLVSSGSKVQVEVIISDVEYQEKTYKRILVQNLRKIKMVV